MKALVLYWSLSGTTRRVAEQIAEGLRAEGAECVLHDLRDGVPGGLAGYDIVGVGFPVHWFRVPFPVSDAIAALAPLGGRSSFAFSLNGSYRGAGLNRARAALARAGGTEIGAFAAHGAGNFYPYARHGWQFSPDHPSAAELDAAREFGSAMARAQLMRVAGEATPAGPLLDPRTYPLYAVERLLSGPRLTRAFYSRHFRVDKERCTRCGKCARRCPVGNIAWERGELPRWGRECALCLECVSTCPEEAIRCPIDWPFFDWFVRQNVRRGLRDPELEHAAVRHRRGRIERI